MKFVRIAAYAFAILSVGAFASEDMVFPVDLHILERNISSCNDMVRTEKQKSIDELKQKPLKDYVVRLNGAFMTKYVQFSNNRACSIGLLDNAILILETYLQSTSEPRSVMNDLAVSKLMRASFEPGEARSLYYREADELIERYINESPIDPNETIATPQYFASHSYIDAAELTNDDDKIMLLDKAIAIAKKGRSIEMNKAMKQQLTEPLGIALGNKAKYYKGKDEARFRGTLEESTQFLIEGFASGDNLAAYNLAISYSLLNDPENAKKWLLVVEERKAVDKQVCLQGLLRDPDLEWFRTNQKEWLVAYFRRNCLPFLPPLPSRGAL